MGLPESSQRSVLLEHLALQVLLERLARWERQARMQQMGQIGQLEHSVRQMIQP